MSLNILPSQINPTLLANNNSKQCRGTANKVVLEYSEKEIRESSVRARPQVRNSR